jgi:hypothetical protein
MINRGHWLTPWRLKTYSLIFLAFFLALIPGFVLPWIHASSPFFIPNDFSVFWEASRIGLSGSPENAYTPGFINSVIRENVPGFRDSYDWYYPPTFYLLVLPLSLGSYWAAYLAFLTASIAAFSVVVKRIINVKTAMWCLAAFPGLWVNIYLGQNGLLTASIAGAALLVLETSPVIAGALIGLLTIKPHLAILFPLALIASRKWRALFVAMLTAAALLGLSIIVLGQNTLESWIHSMSFVRNKLALQGNAEFWLKMPTVFSLFKLVGFSFAQAIFCQAVVAMFAAIGVWRIWSKCDSIPLRYAALVEGTLLVSPYLFTYDLAWLGLAIAWLVQFGLKEGWMNHERELLLAVWALPLAMPLLKRVIDIEIAPIIILALFFTTLRQSMAVRRHPS